MAQGKILIVNKSDGSIIGWFGEVITTEEHLRRPDIENITLLELEPNQYQEEFMNLANGINSVKVIDIANKTLEFELFDKTKVETEEEKLLREKTESENSLLLMTDSQVGGIL